MKHKPYIAKTLSGAQAYARQLLKRIQRDNELMDRLAQERILLAKLAADEPMFFNPIEAMAAKKLRDDVLRWEGVAPTAGGGITTTWEV